MVSASRFLGVGALALMGAQATAAPYQGPCSAAGGEVCDASSSALALGRENALMQYHQDLDRVRVGLSQRAVAAADVQLFQSKVAAHLRSGLISPETMASTLGAGLTAVKEAIVLFVAEPPQIDKAWEVLGSGLFEAILSLIPQETQEADDFKKYKDTWEGVIKSMPTLLQDIPESISAFKDDGNIGAVIDLCARAIQELGVLVTQFLPEEVSKEVTRYLAAVDDGLDGLGASIEVFIEGDATAAVEELYDGIYEASSELLPPVVLEDESVFQKVVGELDKIFQDISEYVLMYRQQLLESSVCWKSFTPREKVRPDKCPERHYWDGEQWCIFNPHASGLLETSHDSALLETAVERKRGRKPHESALPSTCDRNSEFPTKQGGWCFKDCPYGTEPAGARCKSVCMGAYPIASPLMCGKSQGTIASAITEMTISTLRTGLKVVSSGTADLSQTADALVKLGKTFVHPTCPSLS